MSHFSVLVIGNDPEALLAPYDENLEVERYVEATREQLIERKREEISEYATTGPYAEYLRDPEAYAAGRVNADHIEYLRSEFPKKLEWADEERYADAIKWEEAEDITEDGSVTSTRNPLGFWDWWAIGGRWNGYFRLKPSGEGRPVEPHYSEIANEIWKDAPYKSVDEFSAAKAGTTDQAKKRDVDFDAMREHAATVAATRFDEYAAATADLTPPVTWSEFREQHPNINAAREAWSANPWVQKVRSLNYWDADPAEFFTAADDPRAAYIDASRARAITTYAVITPDGEWHAKGRMGWFGMSDDRTERDAWNDRVNELIDAASDDDLFTLIDAHV